VKSFFEIECHELSAQSGFEPWSSWSCPPYSYYYSSLVSFTKGLSIFFIFSMNISFVLSILCIILPVSFSLISVLVLFF
jgi:hypothetical protein